MTTKTTGAEWSAFYADKSAWPEDAWHEDETVTVDGAEVDNLEFDPANLPPNARVTVSGGIVFLNADSTNGPTLEAYFKSWRKKQNTVFMTVEVSRTDAEKVQEAITTAGGKWTI
jgi:hypothetical protein